MSLYQFIQPSFTADPLRINAHGWGWVEIGCVLSLVLHKEIPRRLASEVIEGLIFIYWLRWELLCWRCTVERCLQAEAQMTTSLPPSLTANCFLYVFAEACLTSSLISLLDNPSNLMQPLSSITVEMCSLQLLWWIEVKGIGGIWKEMKNSRKHDLHKTT